MKFAITFLLCLWAGFAHAQSRITVALDGSFKQTTWGGSIRLDGDTFHGVVAFHRVLQHNGRAYACVAIGHPGFANRRVGEEFASRSRIVTAQGAVVRRDLRNWTYLNDVAAAVREVDEPLKDGSGMRSVDVFSGSLRKYAGTRVSCRISRRTQTPSFFSGDTRLVIPEQIRYRIVN